MSRQHSSLLLGLLVAGGLGAQSDTPFHDPHSFSRPDEVAVTHLDLDLTVDFENRRLVGRADLTIERRAAGAETLLLDSRDLDITAVRLDGRGEPALFRLSQPIPFLGRSLEIPLGPETRSVRVEYSTLPNAAALQWLQPTQTSGGRQPFLFTQSQAILARTWVPCQDSPGVRMTYSATIRVPPDLMALMSAENPKAKRADGVYRFRQQQKIPSYLLALAVGDLEFRELGKRSGVYAEAAVLTGAAWELGDTESMIAAAEKLYGPYRWGRYDLLILPPAFPYGGMENPRLTFATPTILAGDRSLVALIAHELAHSWSGNLVTNATWNDFWLNEGFTTYFENRIMEAVYGADYAGMLQQLSRQELEQTVSELGATSRDSWLFADLAGRDPDEGVSAIAYEKGALFLHTLEQAAGRKRWDSYLKRYFAAHAFQAMTTRGFLDDLELNLLEPSPEIAQKVPVAAWVYGPGIPAGAATAKTEAFARVDRELARYRHGALAADLETDGWVTQQWQRFLRELGAPPAQQMADLDTVFAFSRSGNSELLADWLAVAIRTRYTPAYPALEQFLASMGRRKFLRPLYTALAESPEGLARARAIYAKARPGYHSVSRGTVDAILSWKEPAAR